MKRFLDQRVSPLVSCPSAHKFPVSHPPPMVQPAPWTHPPPGLWQSPPCISDGGPSQGEHGDMQALIHPMFPPPSRLHLLPVPPCHPDTRTPSPHLLRPQVAKAVVGTLVLSCSISGPWTPPDRSLHEIPCWLSSPPTPATPAHPLPAPVRSPLLSEPRKGQGLCPTCQVPGASRPPEAPRPLLSAPAPRGSAFAE